jgi:hypothetical protein
MTAMLSSIAHLAIRVTGRQDEADDLVDRIIRFALIAIASPSTHRSMRLAVERAVAAALSLAVPIGKGFEAGFAINDRRRASLDRRVDAMLAPALQKELRTLLIEPIRAGVGNLSWLLEPALNSVGHGIVGSQTRLAGWAYFGAPLWAPYAGQIDYIHWVLGIPLDRHFLDTVERSGLYWTLDGICFAAERPTHINRDEAGHLHCEVGPALAYPSGWSWWHWHGVGVPQSVIEEPERITVEAIGEERHPALRRVMIERYRWGQKTHGIAAYLRDAGARRLDHDAAFGTLWHLDLAGEAPTLMVEVRNHSPEPDGTYRHFFLRVHPELRLILTDGTYGAAQRLTVRNAVASTFGLSGAEYAPDVET